MPSTYTSRLRLTLPATGELINTWGTTVNTGITELVDASIAGAATISTWGGAGIAYTLSNNNGVADEARCMFIVASGAPGENKNIICPAVSKLYVVVNSVTGGYTVTLKTAAGTGIAVENGKTAVLRCDGTNVVNAITQLPAFVVAGGTANQVQYLNASKELTGSANLTFDGTSLTLGGNPTLTAGTANGVLYLNGSKVATSGSALVFDGTNLGLGVTPSTASTFKLLQLPAGGIIGTQGNSVALTSNAVWNSGWKYATTAAASYYAQDTGTHGWFTAASGTAGNAITFTQAMTLDASGNLGLGVTPSAWGAYKALDISTYGAIGSTSGALSILGNAYYNGTNYIYKQSSLATSYDQVTGQHRWSVAPSGTAGNAITFTQAMTLDANSRLYVGNVAGLGQTQRVQAEGGYLAYGDNQGLRLLNTATNGGGVISANTGAGGGITLSSDAGPMLFFTAGTEKMRLDTAGNLGLGVTPSAWASQPAIQQTGGALWGVNAANYEVLQNAFYNGTNYIYRNTNLASRYNQNAGVHSWFTAPSGTAGNAITFTQAMTLDASGRLLIGTTSPPAYGSKLRVEGGIESFSSQFNVSSGTSTPFELVNRSASAGFDFYVNSGGTLAARIDSAGNLGLGVTPSAWSGGGLRGFNIGTAGALLGSVGSAELLYNWYYDGTNNRYIVNAAAAKYAITGSVHSWHVASSGTAGNVISSTQAMTLDANGDLSIGRTTAVGRLTLKAASAGQTLIRFLNESENSGGTITCPTGTGQGLVIGGDGGPLVFGAGGTERARITSGGELCVGTTATNGGARLDVKGVDSTSSTYCMFFENSSNSLLFAVQNDGRWRSGTAAASPYNYVVGATNRDLFVDNGGEIGYVSSVRASKTNIAPVSNVDWLLRLNPVTFNFRKKDADGNYTEEADGPLKHGLIAEEVEAVNSDLCFYDDADKGGELRGVNYTHLITPMLKLLQELKAQNDELRARVAALEAA